jgi:hypothetical protein
MYKQKERIILQEGNKCTRKHKKLVWIFLAFTEFYIFVVTRVENWIFKEGILIFTGDIMIVLQNKKSCNQESLNNTPRSIQSTNIFVINSVI